jgi:hypothetical protein
MAVNMMMMMNMNMNNSIAINKDNSESKIYTN